MTEYLLGIDSGLSKTKAALYCPDGSIFGVSTQLTPLLNQKQNIVELNMLDQWQITCQTIRQVLKETQVSPAKIIAIGVTGFGNGLYLLDKSHKPLCNAITSMDHRAISIPNLIPAEVKLQLNQLALQHVWDAQPGILLKWMKENEHAAYASATTLLFCKDWIRFCLTGSISTDLTDISASGLINNRSRQFDPAIFTLLGIEEAAKCLPDVLPSTAVAGKVTPDAAHQTGLLAGTPVVSGLFDVVANSLGSGLIDPRQLCVIMGTWNINISLSSYPITPRYFRQCTVYGSDDLYACIDSSATSASNLEWFMRQVLGGEISYQDFEGIVDRFAPQDVQIFFMPFINGGLRDDNPGAAFLGLRKNHTRQEMLRAIAEGIVFAHMYHIQNLRNEGVGGAEILLTGGASRSRACCQIMSDVMQMMVKVPQAEETGALGACMAAAVGAGIYPRMSEAVKGMAKIRATYQPDPTAGEIYLKKYATFVEILDWMSSKL